MNLSNSFSTVWRAFRRFDLRYWLRSRLVPSKRFHVVNTGLPPGWHDVDERMLHACMVLLRGYVEKECDGETNLQEWTDELREQPDEHTLDLTDSQAANQAEALAIYRWWQVQRPAEHARLDVWLMRLWGNEPGEVLGSREEYWAFEQELDERDQQMLHRLIDIRRSLWT